MRAALPLLLAAPAAGESFDAYAARWGKSYAPAERAERSAIFAANLAKIEAHNADPAALWTAGVNEFTDMAPSEFKARRTGLHKGMWAAQLAAGAKHVHSNKTAPDSVDWRTTDGVVSKVKDQKSCGSCWAFSTVETVESAVAIAAKKSLILSEQQVVDCSPNPDHCGGTGGCEGSIQPLGFKYIKDVGGIILESDYKYTAKDGKCKDTGKKAATIDGYVSLETNKYHDLLDAVANVGPIAISVAAEPWQSYKSGVFTCSGSGCTDIDHAVQLVGYGTDAAKGDYWLVRNSWGASWGESGYIRIHRQGTHPCKTDNKPGDGFGCTGGPSSVTVCGDSGILSGSSYPTGAKLL